MACGIIIDEDEYIGVSRCGKDGAFCVNCGPRVDHLPAGPTLNQEYNGLLVKWAAGGYEAEPSCEDCGEDLTGKKVFETGASWVCAECSEKRDERNAGPWYDR